MAENERQFEENIEKYLISPDGGYEKADDSGEYTDHREPGNPMVRATF